MSKLLKLKEWLTLADAAQQLATIVGEPVTEADLFQLALLNKLTLSMLFMYPEYARACEPVDFEDGDKFADYVTSPISGSADPSLPEAPAAFHIFGSKSGQFYSTRGHTLLLKEGIYDLPLVASTYNWAVARCKNLADGVQLKMSEGAYLMDILSHDGKYVELLKRVYPEPDYIEYEPNKSFADKLKLDSTGELPDHALVVVRSSALLELQNSLQDSQPGDDKTQKQNLDPREETIYLNIIGALLELITDSRHAVFDKDAPLIDLLLTSHPGKQGIKERTLQQKFAAAKRSLKAS